MKVTSLGVILEVGVPKVSSEGVSKENINDEVASFLKNLVRLGNLDVVYTDYKNGEPCPIFSFNYSIFNQTDKNDKYDVFRFFQNTIYVTSNSEINYQETFGQNHWYRKGELLFSCSVCSIGEHNPDGKQIEYVGSSPSNSAEVVEKRVEQYSLF